MQSSAPPRRGEDSIVDGRVNSMDEVQGKFEKVAKKVMHRQDVVQALKVRPPPTRKLIARL